MLLKAQSRKKLHEYKIEKVLVVDDNDQLVGLITTKDIEKSQNKPNACKDSLGRLRVGAVVGTAANTKDRVTALAREGVDVVVVDTAHGHSQGVLDMVKWVKENFLIYKLSVVILQQLKQLRI